MHGKDEKARDLWHFFVDVCRNGEKGWEKVEGKKDATECNLFMWIDESSECEKVRAGIRQHIKKTLALWRLATNDSAQIRELPNEYQVHTKCDFLPDLPSNRYLHMC